MATAFQCTLAVVALVWLTPTAALADTFYVALAGDDQAAGTQAAPFRTVHKGASVLKPGDTVLVRAGVYEEEFYNDIPGGTSWDAAVTLAAYPGDKPTLRPPAGAGRVFSFASAAVSWIVVDGFELDAVNAQYDAVKVTWGSSEGASHHIRLRNCEVKNSPGQGILVTGDPSSGVDVYGNEFIGLSVHDNGTTDFDHGLYISTRDNLVEGCDVFHNAGWGVHVYNGDATAAHNNIIRNNRVHDNAAAGNRGVGIGLYSGKGSVAYNNLVWGNKTGISVNYDASEAQVLNNTVVANIESGIIIGDAASATVVKNNIVFQNGSGVEDQGSSTLEANLVDVDPLFAQIASQDYHLTASSPAIDTGVAVAAVAADYDGTPRPQGNGFDIGAFEFTTASAGAAGSGPLPPDGGAGQGGGSGTGGSAQGGASGGGVSGNAGHPGSGGSIPPDAGGNVGAADEASESSGGCGCIVGARPQLMPEGLLLGICAFLRSLRVRSRRT